MYMNDVIRYCESHGKKYSRMAIYNAGKKHGFVFKVEGKSELVFDREKFLEWFNGACEEIPEGYISIKEMREKYKLPINKSYLIAKDEKANAKYIGAGKGILYVDERNVEELIKKYSNKRTYNWED